MHWLSSPKVRLALIVNGLYFISLLTPPAAPTRPRLFARAAEARTASKQTQPFAPLAPPSAPTKATTKVMKEFDQLDVYLENDLLLVSKPGHRLYLSPTFTTKASRPKEPDSVLLRFVSYSDVKTLSNTTPLSITADGVDEVNESTHLWYGGGAVPGSSSPVVEGVGVELPYEVFIEIVSARQVIVQLGPDRVELTAVQIEALRDMHRRLPPPEDPPPPPAVKIGRPSAVTAEPKVIQWPPDSRH
ncbi:MAG: hypothetical protein JOZ02_12590 [Acidobacteria bacterium]|nr:hypothetical protein [Acidobacteriota bacterium]